MNVHTKPGRRQGAGKSAAVQSAQAPASPIAPDCAGQDFYAIDAGLQQLLALYLPADTCADHSARQRLPGPCSSTIGPDRGS